LDVVTDLFLRKKEQARVRDATLIRVEYYYWGSEVEGLTGVEINFSFPSGWYSDETLAA